MLSFQCGVCQTRLEAPAEQSGKLVRCPKCQTTLRVPTPHRETVPSAAPLSASAAPPHNLPAPARTGAAKPMGGKRYGFNCQYCSSRLETVESLAGQEGACPTCGSAIIIPILDRYGRLIDPMTGNVIKQDPHPVHAYAAAGERAPRIIRRAEGGQGIACPKCKAISPITSNNCKSCGMPFTMEGTTADAAGASNGYAIASLVLGIVGLPTCMIGAIAVLGLVFGLIAYSQTGAENGGAGRGLAIAGVACSGFGICLTFAYYSGVF